MDVEELNGSFAAVDCLETLVEAQDDHFNMADLPSIKELEKQIMPQNPERLFSQIVYTKYMDNIISEWQSEFYLNKESAIHDLYQLYVDICTYQHINVKTFLEVQKNKISELVPYMDSRRNSILSYTGKYFLSIRNAAHLRKVAKVELFIELFVAACFREKLIYEHDLFRKLIHFFQQLCTSNKRPIYHTGVFLAGKHLTGLIRMDAKIRRNIRNTKSALESVEDSEIIEKLKTKCEKLKDYDDHVNQFICFLQSRIFKENVNYQEPTLHVMRLDLIVELYKWIEIYPERYLQNENLKYLVKAMTDNNKDVRRTAIDTVCKIVAYFEPQVHSKMQMLIHVIAKQVKDIDFHVAITAVNTLTVIQRSGSGTLITSKIKGLLFKNIYNVCFPLAEASGRYLKEYLERKNVDGSDEKRLELLMMFESNAKSHGFGDFQPYLVESMYDSYHALRNVNAFINVAESFELDEEYKQFWINILTESVHITFTGKCSEVRIRQRVYNIREEVKSKMQNDLLKSLDFMLARWTNVQLIPLLRLVRDRLREEKKKPATATNKQMLATGDELSDEENKSMRKQKPKKQVIAKPSKRSRQSGDEDCVEIETIESPTRKQKEKKTLTTVSEIEIVTKPTTRSESKSSKVNNNDVVESNDSKIKQKGKGTPAIVSQNQNLANPTTPAKRKSSIDENDDVVEFFSESPKKKQKGKKTLTTVSEIEIVTKSKSSIDENDDVVQFFNEFSKMKQKSQNLANPTTPAQSQSSIDENDDVVEFFSESPKKKQKGKKTLTTVSEIEIVTKSKSSIDENDDVVEFFNEFSKMKQKSQNLANPTTPAQSQSSIDENDDVVEFFSESPKKKQKGKKTLTTVSEIEIVTKSKSSIDENDDVVEFFNEFSKMKQKSQNLANPTTPAQSQSSIDENDDVVEFFSKSPKIKQKGKETPAIVSQSQNLANPTTPTKRKSSIDENNDVVEYFNEVPKMKQKGKKPPTALKDQTVAKSARHAISSDDECDFVVESPEKQKGKLTVTTISNQIFANPTRSKRTPAIVSQSENLATPTTPAKSNSSIDENDDVVESDESPIYKQKRKETPTALKNQIVAKSARRAIISDDEGDVESDESFTMNQKEKKTSTTISNKIASKPATRALSSDDESDVVIEESYESFKMNQKEKKTSVSISNKIVSKPATRALSSDDESYVVKKRQNMPTTVKNEDPKPATRSKYKSSDNFVKESDNSSKKKPITSNENEVAIVVIDDESDVEIKVDQKT